MSEKDGPHITKNQACRLLGVTRQWLNKLIADGVIPSGPRGQVPLVGAVQGYIRHLDAMADRRGGADATRIASARASELELRNNAKSAALVPRWEIEHAIGEVFTLAEAELATLPKRIKTTPEIRTVIRREAQDAAARIAETRAASERFLQTGGALI